MSSGVAAEGMRRTGRDRPTPLPVQALDHATGYLLAAAVVRALRVGASTARCSLARTARLLVDGPPGSFDDALAPLTAADFGPDVEATTWGPAHRLSAPLTIEGVPMRWDRPAVALGSSKPQW